MFDKLQALSAEGRRPHLSQLVIWGLVYIGCRRTYTSLPADNRAPSEIASVFSFLPNEILTNPLVFESLRWVLPIAGVLWSLHVLTPLSSWLTVVSFTGVVALYYENSSHIAHTYNLAVLVLLVHAGWYHFRRREIGAAIKSGTFWESTLYPGWVFHLSVLCIAVFHTYAGLSKLWVSGFGWANGQSLQLWIHLWGVDSGLKEFLLSNRTAAMGLQVATLVLESCAVLAIISTPWRWAVGVALMGLYLGILATFNFNFQYNALIVALFFLPAYTVLNWLFERIQSVPRLTLRFRRQSGLYSVLRWLRNRVDILGVFDVRLDDEAFTSVREDQSQPAREE